MFSPPASDYDGLGTLLSRFELSIGLVYPIVRRLVV